MSKNFHQQKVVAKGRKEKRETHKAPGKTEADLKTFERDAIDYWMATHPDRDDSTKGPIARENAVQSMLKRKSPLYGELADKVIKCYKAECAANQMAVPQEEQQSMSR